MQQNVRLRTALVGVLAILLVGAIVGLWLGLRDGPPREGERRARSAGVSGERSAEEIGGLSPFDAPRESSATGSPAEREAAPPPPKTGLAVTVRRNDGRPASFAQVLAIGSEFRKKYCDEKGRAWIAVEPGEYEVLLPSRPEKVLVQVYPPDGRSSVEAVVTAGKLTEVELTVYLGAALQCHFVNEAGENHWIGGFATWELSGEEWVDPIDRRQDPNGQCRIGGLAAGTYGIAPSGRGGWFEPQVIEVLLGETKNVVLKCEELVDLKLDVRVRASADGPTLPIWLAATAISLESWPLPLPDRDWRRPGRTRSPNEIALSLYPGPWRIFLRTYGESRVCQIVKAKTLQWDVEVPVDGAPEWPPFEFLLGSVGKIATVTGQLVGSRERGGTGYYLDYEGPGGEQRSVRLFPDREDESFLVVVDLGQVEENSIELFMSRRSARTLVQRFLLTPGEQEWSVVLPPR